MNSECFFMTHLKFQWDKSQLEASVMFALYFFICLAWKVTFGFQNLEIIMTSCKRSGLRQTYRGKKTYINISCKGHNRKTKF